jgi:hypothetical protein
MHTIRKNDLDGVETWEVIFVFPDDGTRTVIMTKPDFDSAMIYCSFLNGGMAPWGYTMSIQNVGS